MSGIGRFFFAAVCMLCFGSALVAQPLVLDGRSLSPSDVISVSRDRLPIVVDDAAWQRVRTSHLVLKGAARACQKIYGLTTGVGANKDHAVLKCLPDEPEEDYLDILRAFNIDLLHAHGAATGPALPPELVRAILLIRLNTALDGGSGMQEAVVRRLSDYLARDILPVIPSEGSLGQADITVLSHIGLTMIDKWDVTVDGVRLPAAEANAEAGLPKIDFLYKDALGSFSSNAFGAALASFALEDLKHTSNMARLVVALSLEGLNGNVAPFLPETGVMRPFPYVAGAAEDLLTITAGSYLYEEPTDELPRKRALQDPLSYRTAAYQLGTLDRTLAELDKLLRIQINAADDNPVIYVGKVDPVTAAIPDIKLLRIEVDASNDTRVVHVSEVNPETAVTPDNKAMPSDVTEGAVVPSANFAALPIAIGLQSAGLAAAHVSHGAVYRTLKLMDPAFTHLPPHNRFLNMDPDGNGHAFGAIHKPIVALMARNRELANPVSLDFAPVALGIEDMATNMPLAAQRLQEMSANLQTILGFELMLAAQAVDLRLQSENDLPLSPVTRQLLREFRAWVEPLDSDTHILTRDIANAAAFVSACRLEKDAYGEVNWKTQMDDGVLCAR